jgi:Protein of unknown function (DUF2934)
MDPKHTGATGGDRLAAMAGDLPADRPGVRTGATCDHAEIRRWAARHKAEPATGEATASGPAVRDVNDLGAGIRFNFPGFAPLRPITWEEWFGNFDEYELVFMYEEEDTGQVAERAHARWQARGSDSGNDRQDWFEAERDLQRNAGGGSPSVRYRLVRNKHPR